MSKKKSTRDKKTNDKTNVLEDISDMTDTPNLNFDETETSDTQFTNIDERDITGAIDDLDEENDDDDNLGDDAEIDDEDIDISINENSYNNDVYDDDKCLYKYADDKAELTDEDTDYEEEVFDDDIEQYGNIVPPDDRITIPFLYNFERVRIIGDRAKQLALGAKPMIKGVESLTPKEIAEQELEKNIIPFIIERDLPNGKKERWFLKELAH